MVARSIPLTTEVPGPVRPVSVVLIRPPFLVPQSGYPVGPVPSAGLAYIAGAVRAAGHEVRVIDAAGEDIEQSIDVQTHFGTIRRIGLSYDEILERIDPDTEVIGISHMFVCEWPMVRELASLIRRRCAKAVIILGGENATGFWRWIFDQSDDIDGCVLGEGEATIVTVLDRVAQGRSLAGLQGVALHPQHGDETPPALPDRIHELASIARPAWDLFPVQNYFRFRNAFGTDRGRSLPVLATRGCPYRCTFCSSPQMWTTRYKVRDPEDLADEIAGYVEEYGVESIDFTDLTAMTKRSWILDFCDAIERRGLSISMQLPIGTRSEAFDEEVLDRLYEVGCRDIRFAPESGSPRILDLYNKKVDLEHLLWCIRMASRRGHAVTAFFIVGHPAERWKDIYLTAKFITRASVAGLELPIVGTYHPYPGSKDFEAAVESGILVPDDDYCWAVLAHRTNYARSWNAHLHPKPLLTLARALMVVWGFGLCLISQPNRIQRLVRVVFMGSSGELVDGDAVPDSRRRTLRGLLVAWAERPGRSLDEVVHRNGMGTAGRRGDTVERSGRLPEAV